MEQKSLDRRQSAVKRIVGRASRTRDLIQILDPRTPAIPRMLVDRIPAERLNEQYGLNDRQADALSALLATRPLALTQAPPGTTKTVLLAAPANTAPPPALPH